MNLLEAKELLKNKGYTVRRLNECGGGGGCGGSSSYSSGCGSSGGCGSISRSVRVGCGSGGYISNSCSSSGCGSYYYDDEDKIPVSIFLGPLKQIYEFTGYSSYYGCAEYKNKTGKIIIDVNKRNNNSKFAKIISLARKLRISEIRTVEIIETLYESGISREIAYNLLAKLNMLPDKLLRMPITHVK